MSRVPSLNLPATAAALEDWLAEHDSVDRRTVAVENAFVYVTELIAVAELREACSGLLERIKVAQTATRGLMAATAGFVHHARTERLKADEVTDFDDPDFEDPTSKIFTAEEIAKIERLVAGANEHLGELGIAADVIESRRAAPGAHTPREEAASLRHLIALLRFEDAVTWREIGVLVVDKELPVETRVQRYKKLMQRAGELVRGRPGRRKGDRRKPNKNGGQKH